MTIECWTSNPTPRCHEKIDTSMISPKKLRMWWWCNSIVPRLFVWWASLTTRKVPPEAENKSQYNDSTISKHFANYSYTAKRKTNMCWQVFVFCNVIATKNHYDYKSSDRNSITLTVVFIVTFDFDLVSCWYQFSCGFRTINQDVMEKEATVSISIVLVHWKSFNAI
jgi:hypothetical protein